MSVLTKNLGVLFPTFISPPELPLLSDESDRVEQNSGCFWRFAIGAVRHGNRLPWQRAILQASKKHRYIRYTIYVQINYKLCIVVNAIKENILKTKIMEHKKLPVCSLEWISSYFLEV